MVELCRFYGIVISVYPPPREHGPAHFHVRYGEDKASVAISDGSVMRGSLPRRAAALVADWYALHSAELQVAWNQLQVGVSPTKIAPLE